MIYFDALTESDCEQVRKWRNEDISAARTPFLLTADMQRDFYREVSNRDSKHRYWAICEDQDVDSDIAICWPIVLKNGGKIRNMLGIAGLTNIEWENGCAEIALMIAPDERGQGYGSEAFELIKLWGFARMRLHTIYACVYDTNPHLIRWWRERKPTEECSYPGGKFWDGVHYGTYHMTWVNNET